MRDRLYHIIFEAESPAGKAFDIGLIIAVLLAVAVTLLDSVAAVNARYGELLWSLEWVFTVLFALEYSLRLYCAPKPWRYARSFYGLVDLIGWLPTVLSYLVPGTHVLTTFRVIRVLRVFRVLKMASYLKEATMLSEALTRSRRKILVFLCFVLTLTVLLGSLMYMIEGPEHGFANIPISIYWAIVTLTTVGYGDIHPVTPLGQALSSLVMILGYAILAVPTGIVISENLRQQEDTKQPAERRCASCGKEIRYPEADYCPFCGAALDKEGC